ncbi:uncharacterized protein LOC117171385 [Belonocnema kinseyi]|uniref:uncharacterized protein LOC117171385 n=1 Tax=Belonocnema kinseyi TaxID=2817044 RepID=UPI00143CF150|nr:uncharacterized protein LOC117171385 [Belonocnema kinseyi]
MESFEFTSDEEIQAFNHENKKMDCTGYVDMIEGIKTLKTAEGHVLKFVLNNASKSSMRVLM